MTRRLISTGSPFERAAGYSRAVVDGDMVWLAGVTGFDYAGMTIGEDVVEQAEQAFRTIAAVLADAGAALADIVRVTYILADAADWPRLAPVFARHLGEVRPAAMAIVAGLIDPRMKIEIEVTAKKRS